jgi:high-affinity Fe2+/Pb2+ permease
VRYLVTTEIGFVVAFAVGLVIAYIGIAMFISGRHQFAGVLVLGLGLWLMLYAPILHDRVHRERGEESHALWGRGDRRKPPWWPAR